MPLLNRMNLKLMLPVMLMGCFLWVVGCTSETDQMLDSIDTSVLSAKRNDLSRTMDFVFDDRQFDQKDFEQKVSLGLNRWANYSAGEAKSAAVDESEQVKELLEENSDLAVINRREGLVFLNTDAYFLQESFWISQIAQRVVEEDAVSLFELYRLAADNYVVDSEEENSIARIVGKLNSGLDEGAVTSLTKSIKCFDWVVRNVYLLDELVPTEDDIEQQRLNDAEDPAAAGVRMLGQQRHPWQTLITGRGDYVDRAKVLLLMLRAVDLDAVMLFAGDDAKPWAVGVAINDDYFLFDTKMGLPIPGEKLGSVATLKALRANKELLSGLDLTIEESLADDSKYWVRPEQTEKLMAKTYVVPESLAQRMAGLESSLVGENRLNLGAFPSKEMARLPKLEGVENSLWDIAIETHRFRKAVGEAIPKAVSEDQLSDRLRWYYSDEAYIDQFHSYRTNRVRFFKGKFESLEEDRRRNAVESCQVLMYSDDDIDTLATDKTMMAIAGVADDKNPVTFEATIKSVQAQMKLVRRDVGLFLSQCLFDNGNPGTAANWLEGIARKDDVDRWRAGIEYLLGRSFESRKEYDLAVEQYRKEDSNQLHGNLIRTRLLNAAVAKAYPAASSKKKPAKKESAKEEQAKEEQAKEEQAKEEQAKEEQAKEEQAKEDAAKNEPASAAAMTTEDEKETEDEASAVDEGSIDEPEVDETVDEPTEPAIEETDE